MYYQKIPLLMNKKILRIPLLEINKLFFQFEGYYLGMFEPNLAKMKEGKSCRKCDSSIRMSNDNIKALYKKYTEDDPDPKKTNNEYKRYVKNTHTVPPAISCRS